jgi:hypothetical protein
MKSIQLILIASVALLNISCSRQVSEEKLKKVTMKNQTSENVEKTIRSIFIGGVKANVVECPVKAYGKAREGTKRYCFGSDLEPKALLSAITNALEPIASTYMAWRQDVGTWVSIYDFNESKYSLSISMKMPATRELMKDDPSVNKYVTIIACYITL